MKKRSLSKGIRFENLRLVTVRDFECEAGSRGFSFIRVGFGLASDKYGLTGISSSKCQKVVYELCWLLRHRRWGWLLT